jgi:hypothetical protein
MLVKMRYLNILSYGIFLYLAAHVILNVFNSQITGWSLSELLINYQGGFVRRGLIGEVLFQSDNPLALAHNIQRFFVAGFLCSVLIVLILEKDILTKFLLLVLVTFTSGGVFDLVLGGGFEYLDRKEIWFYSVLGLILVSTRAFGFYNLKNILIINFLSILMTLHHELYAVFTLPLMLLIVILSGTGYLFKSIALIVPTLITLLLVINYSGDHSIASLIKESYSLKFGIDVGGAVDAVGWSYEFSHNLSRRMITEGSLRYWLYHLVVNLVFLTIFAIYKGKTVRDLFIYMAIIFIVLSATIFAMFAGWDWGRWISMFAFISIFFIYIASSVLSNIVHIKFFKTQNNEISDRLRMQIASVMLLCLLVGLNTNVRMGHCCTKPNNLEFVQSAKLKGLVYWYGK